MPTNRQFPIGISNDSLICKFSDGQVRHEARIYREG